MKLHKEAYPTLFFASVLFILFNLGMWRLLAEYVSLFNFLFAISLLLLCLVFYFFRVPFSVKPIDSSKVVSPAHGKIVEIVNEEQPNYYEGKRKRISIFMSPLNIHCNYAPIQGEVQSMEYYPGKYLVAFHPKSSLLNEHTYTAIKNDRLEVGVKQIAGFLARRIIPYLSPGQHVLQNEELGFIKFGSRVDLFLPIDTTINVKVGERVKGGITVIAEY